MPRWPPRNVEETAQVCAGCHGENGIPQEKTTPVIWGQNEGYLYLQLRDFKSGARKNDQMGPIAADAREGRHEGAGRILHEAQVARSAAAVGAARTSPPRP